jgi:hypothetical protein
MAHVTNRLAAKYRSGPETSQESFLKKPRIDTAFREHISKYLGGAWASYNCQKLSRRPKRS